MLGFQFTVWSNVLVTTQSSVACAKQCFVMFFSQVIADKMSTNQCKSQIRNLGGLHEHVHEHVLASLIAICKITSIRIIQNNSQ